MIEIKPGDLVELSCSDGSAKVTASVGTQIPPSSPAFLVMKLDKNAVTLGPLKAGEFVFDVPCSQGPPIKAQLKLTALKSNELPEPAPPEGLLLLSYPLWFWIALLLIFASASYLVIWLYQKYKARFASTPSTEGSQEASPEQIFLDFLKSCRRERLAERTEATSIEFLYQKGQEHLRRYLEYRLGFRASWATSSEFVAQYRSASLSYNKLPATVSMVESLMMQSDGVRFSKALPDQPSREAFVRGLEGVASAIQKAMQADT